MISVAGLQLDLLDQRGAEPGIGFREATVILYGLSKKFRRIVQRIRVLPTAAQLIACLQVVIIGFDAFGRGHRRRQTPPGSAARCSPKPIGIASSRAMTTCLAISC